MPFVLKHKQSSFIYTGMLVNNYKIAFYGVKYWETPAEAEREAPEFIASEQLDPAQWDMIEVEEHTLKLFNVKLANNPQRRVTYASDGTITVHND